MLDRLCLSRHRRLFPERPLDVGALGEAMLFYGEVRLFADRAVMNQLVRELTPDELFTALSEGYLRITYVDGGFGIVTNNSGTPFELHRPVSFRVESMAFDDVVDNAFAAKTSNESKARKLRRRLSPYIDQHHWDDKVQLAVLQDLQSGEYVAQAVRAVIKAAAPGLAGLDSCSFEVSEQDGLFSVATDIDFSAVNLAFHRQVSPDVATISPAFILAELVEGQVQLQRSAEYQADLATDSLTSELLELKCADIIERSTRSHVGIEIFQDRLLTGRAVREAVNDGQRSFSDLLDVIHDARRFRSWLQSTDEDRDLLDAYYEEISKRSWIDRLPTKAVRWAIFGTAGLSLAALGLPPDAATVAALGLGAVDELLLDRIGHGWRPSQFVDGNLSRFVHD
ncbi:MAG: hypothetical protein WB565_10090 [Acidimicrobiales bacterium]